jgi:anti-anti-sigma regulatory factor
MTSAPAPGIWDQATQRARLRQFLAWIIPIVFGFALLYGGIGAVFGDLPTMLNSVILLGYGCLLLVAWTQFRRERLRAAVLIICIGLLIGALAITVLQPSLYPNFGVVPLLAVAIALQYLRGGHLRGLLLACWAGIIAIVLIGEFVPYQSQLPPWLLIALRVSSLAATSGLVLLSLWQFGSRLAETLLQTQAANLALQSAMEELEAARAEAHLRLLAENAAQRATIQELSAPVLPLNRTTMLMPLIGTLDRERLYLAQTQALTALHSSSARLLVLDITGVIAVDNEMAQGLVALSQAVQLLGAEVALVGIRAEVAHAMINLGVNVQGLRTYRNLEMGSRFRTEESPVGEVCGASIFARPHQSEASSVFHNTQSNIATIYRRAQQ